MGPSENLSAKHDIVIGAITNYTHDQIQYWINSLERSGFEGGKILLCYNVDAKTLDYIRSHNIETCILQQDKEDNAIYPKENWNIVVERFFHYWQLFRFVLKQHVFRFVIATDVKDVIFQTNPSDWLHSQILWKGSDPIETLFLSSENLTYENEPWGFDNICNAFGSVIRNRYEQEEIINCGVLAGTQNAMLDLFLNIALICNGIPAHIPGGGGPDQAALNILMGLTPYKQISQKTYRFSAQLGTTGDPRKMESFKGHHVSNVLPEWDGEYFTNSFDHQKYPIVHQWDRMSPEIVQKIKEKYS